METKSKTTDKNTILPKLKFIIKSDRNKSKSPQKNKNLDDSNNSLSPESKALKNINSYFVVVKLLQIDKI